MLLRRLAVPVAAVVALGGCAAFSDEPAQTSDDGTPVVLASVYPLQFLAEQIGGDRVEVTSLTPAGADPHTLELAPRTVAEMGSATLVVYLSGFQAAVDEAVDVTGAPAFDAADHTDLLAAGSTEHERHGHDEHEHADDDAHGHAADDHDHDHDHDDDGGHEDDDAHAGHDHGPLDPHFWLDPERLATVGEALAEELAEADPEGASTYRANAQDLSAQLQQLDDELAAGLEHCASDTIVVAHEAYAYLTTPHGLHQEGLSGIDPESEPSPARLAEIADVVAEQDVSTIFVETLLNPAVTRALADDLGVSTAVLDPLENQQDEDADYLDVMRANLGALQDALGCEAA